MGARTHTHTLARAKDQTATTTAAAKQGHRERETEQPQSTINTNIGRTINNNPTDRIDPHVEGTLIFFTSTQLYQQRTCTQAIVHLYLFTRLFCFSHSASHVNQNKIKIKCIQVNRTQIQKYGCPYYYVQYNIKKYNFYKYIANS